MTNTSELHMSKEQKEAVGLLSIGTFLEYFDFMLYIHMAIFLNELFFPKTDPQTAALISAFSFCSTYLLRPFGALIFGRIGDYVGRKAVIIITTFLMAVSCAIIATLPTYAQIGITASWILTICRLAQGLAASAEICGAELYLTESSKPPIQYPLVAAVTIFSALGTSIALGIAALFTNPNIYVGESSWRFIFIIGAGVALVGTIGRTSLKEVGEFANKKRKIEEILKRNDIYTKEESVIEKENVHWLTAVAYFLIQCGRPPCFYFVYIYCGDLLKRECGFSANEIITQNFFVSLVDIVILSGISYLSYYVHPLKILRVKFYLFFACFVFFPIVLSYSVNSFWIFVFQALVCIFIIDHVPASPILYRNFPVLKRFTYTNLLTAFAKLLTYLVTSFGLVFLSAKFGHWGLFLIFVPIGLGFITSVGYFESLSKKLTPT